MRVVFVGLAVIALVGCSAQKPDFGTLPRVEVTLGKDPEPRPALNEERASEDQTGETSAQDLGDLPDPPPLRTKRYLEYTVRFDQGELSVISTRAVELAQPASTERKLGRFAFEFWVGRTLLERVRFDFPLLATTPEEDGDPFEMGLASQTVVAVPWVERASQARIFDRKSRQETSLPWPPAVQNSSSASPQNSR